MQEESSVIANELTFCAVEGATSLSMDRTLLYPYIVSEVTFGNNRSGRRLQQQCASHGASPAKIYLKVICLKFCVLFYLNHAAL